MLCTVLNPSESMVWILEDGVPSSVKRVMCTSKTGIVVDIVDCGSNSSMMGGMFAQSITAIRTQQLMLETVLYRLRLFVGS